MKHLARLTAVITLLAVGAVLTGCGTAPGSGSATGADPGRDDAAWVTLLRSGGLTGDLDRVTVSRNGTVAVTRYGRDPVRRSMPADQLDQFVAAVEAANLPEVVARGEGQGADLYSYTITADGTTVSFDDASIPPQVQDLLAALTAWL